jgi:hypothetical protein
MILSPNTVAVYVSDLMVSIECYLKENCKHLIAYSFTIDRSTDIAFTVRLDVFIRDANVDFRIMEEPTELVHMK